MSNTNEPSPASAGSHGEKCRCSLRTRLVGDGCEHCNPALMIDILREQMADMRLTDEEREAIRRAIVRCTVSERARRLSGMDDLADEDRTDAETFSGLLERIG